MRRFEGPSVGLLLAGLTMLILIGGSAARADEPPDGYAAAWRDVDARTANLLSEQGIVGGALWFFHGAEAIGRQYYGMADLASGRPVDEDTIFHWASITKSFTGLAIMQLRDRGLLSLDDPVARYLPEVRAIHNPFGAMDDVTIRQVMSHSTGMRASTWPWDGGESWQPFEPTRWSQLVAMFPYTELAFAPGSRYSYSNPAILFLGRIIEQLADEPFEAYVHKHIFMPLGMSRSYFDVTPPYLLGDRANSYRVEGGQPRPLGLDFNTGVTVSNSGLNAPVADLGRYAAFLMGSDGAVRSRYDQVLARRSLEEMFEPGLPMTDPVSTGDGEGQRIGLTFFVAERGGYRLVGHTGSQQGFRAFLYVDPAGDTAAVAVFNTAGTEDGGRPDAEFVLGQVRAWVFEALFPLFAP